MTDRDRRWYAAAIRPAAIALAAIEPAAIRSALIRSALIRSAAIVLATACLSAACGGGGQGDRRRDAAPEPKPEPAVAGATGAPGASATPAQAAPLSGGFPRTIRDASGESLTIPRPPQRIVSQTLGTDEILFAICPPSRIVGVSALARDPAYSHVVDAARAGGQPAIDGSEIALTLKPDLVFVASYSRAEVVEGLRASKAPIFRFSTFDRIADVVGNIRTVGEAIGEEAAAARVIADMEVRLARVRARAAASGRRPRVMSYDSLGYTAGRDTLFDDVIRAAGGVNVSAESGAKGFSRVGGEQVLAWQAEYLVVGAASGEEALVRRRTLANPAIAASAAVKAGHLIVMDTRDFLTTSHYVVNTVEALANALYGPEPAR